MRTTVYLPRSMHQRLLMVSRRKNKSISDLVRDAVDKALVHEEASQLDRIYAEMEKVKGICRDSVTDASATIDEELYGEKGAWQGSV